MRQYKLDETAKFMEIKSANPKIKQSEIPRKPKISSSILHGIEEKQTCFHLIDYLHHQKLTQGNKGFQTIPSMSSK